MQKLVIFIFLRLHFQCDGYIDNVKIGAYATVNKLIAHSETFHRSFCDFSITSDGYINKIKIGSF